MHTTTTTKGQAMRKIPLLVALGITLAGCSNTPDDQGTPETDALPGEAPMHECEDPAIWAQERGQCEALGFPDPTGGWIADPQADLPQPPAPTYGSEPEFVFEDEQIRVGYEITGTEPYPEDMYHPGMDTALYVTLTVTNEGTEPREFGTDPGEIDPQAIFAYGANGLTDGGNYVTDTEWPTRLMPGTSHGMDYHWTYPGDETTGEIRVTIVTDNIADGVLIMPEHRFTDVPL